jgi:hypothetical protein
MRITLTLHELSRSRTGPIMGTGPIVEYRVGNLLPGEDAFIANFGSRYEDRWRTLQAKDGKDTPWSGNYTTAAEALNELQKQY